MGAGNGIRLASLPAVLLLTPWGTFTRELVRLALEHSGRTSARAGNRVAGGGSAVTLQRDAAEVHACRSAARAFRREPGHGRARQPAEHRSSSARSAADRARGCRRFAVWWRLALTPYPPLPSETGEGGSAVGDRCRR